MESIRLHLIDSIHSTHLLYSLSGPTMRWSLSYNMLEISGLMSDLLIVNNCSIITRIDCII